MLEPLVASVGARSLGVRMRLSMSGDVDDHWVVDSVHRDHVPAEYVFPTVESIG